MDIDQLLKVLLEKKGSDLHLSEGVAPMIRVDGVMQKLDHPVLSKKEMQAVVAHVLTSDQQQRFQESLEIDISYRLGKTSRFRINFFNQVRGIAATFRAIPLVVPTPESLNLPQALIDFCGHQQGLVIVTGPTGSGKTTTLAAMLDFINVNSEKHIVSIEDPVEFVHESKRSLINQRALGENTKSFANALKSVLRQDPDIIFIGEMRDLETIRLALTAAETGHLVFATLHTNSAPQSINRLIDVFPAQEKTFVRMMIAESLRGIVSQRLLPAVMGGRVAAFEILVATHAVRNLIMQEEIQQLYSVIQTNKELGMQTMDQHIAELIEYGVVPPLVMNLS